MCIHNIDICCVTCLCIHNIDICYYLSVCVHDADDGYERWLPHALDGASLPAADHRLQ
jgi:hypothetical protein